MIHHRVSTLSKGGQISLLGGIGVEKIMVIKELIPNIALTEVTVCPGFGERSPERTTNCVIKEISQTEFSLPVAEHGLPGPTGRRSELELAKPLKG